LKAQEPPSRQHFISMFYSCLDAPNTEFQNFVTTLYTDYCLDGPTKQLSMLQLLDKFDMEYKRLETLGCWERKKDPEILALTATISNLQAQLSTLKTQQAMIAKTSNPNPNPTNNGPPSTRKPPPKQAGAPETTEFQGFTWKWCDKCFNGSWNRTHVTSEHVAGIGKRTCRRPPSQENTAKKAATTTNANLPPTTTATPEPTPPSTTTMALQSSVVQNQSLTLNFFYN